jgi:hypothetical protein
MKGIFISEQKLGDLGIPTSALRDFVGARGYLVRLNDRKGVHITPRSESDIEDIQKILGGKGQSEMPVVHLREHGHPPTPLRSSETYRHPRYSFR